MKQIWMLALLAACEPQVDGGYSGEPLARVSGTIRNTRTLPVVDAEVVAIWPGDSPAGDLVAVNAVAVDNAFPSKFTLTIYEPIGPQYLVTIPGASFGYGLIYVAERGTLSPPAEDGEDDDTFPPGILGLAANHLLVYLPEDVSPGSTASYILRGEPRAGFHLYGIRKLTEAEIEERFQCREALGFDAPLAEVFATCGGVGFDDFVPLEGNLDAPIEIDLVDDPSSIEPPNVG